MAHCTEHTFERYLCFSDNTKTGFENSTNCLSLECGGLKQFRVFPCNETIASNCKTGKTNFQYLLCQHDCVL